MRTALFTHKSDIYGIMTSDLMFFVGSNPRHMDFLIQVQLFIYVSMKSTEIPFIIE